MMWCNGQGLDPQSASGEFKSSHLQTLTPMHVDT
jgi:hypothetical protein